MSAIINIRGVIGLDPEATPEHLESELAKAAGEDVLILINSPGGFLFEGLEMANQIRRHPQSVTVRVTGIAASMASYIAVAANVMEVEDNAVFMIHNPAMFSMGDHRDMEKTARILESLTALLAKAYVAKSGQSVDAIRDAMDNESWFFGEEITDAGFADSTINAGDGPESRTEALQSATVAVTLCIEALKSKGEDFTKVAALLTGVEPAARIEPEIEPIEKEHTMTLAEFLKENPEAKAEVDVMVEEAKSGVVNAATEAKKVLGSGVYPLPVQSIVLDMIIEGNLPGISAAASVYDQMQELAKSEAAKKADEETKETPSEEPKSGEGIIASQADVDETRKRLDAKHQ